MALFFGYFLLCVGLTLIIGSVLSAIGRFAAYLDEATFNAEKFVAGSFLVAFPISFGVVCMKVGCDLTY